MLHVACIQCVINIVWYYVLSIASAVNAWLLLVATLLLLLWIAAFWAMC